MYVKMKDTIIERMTNFMKLGSGWRFRSIVKLDVHTVKYTPLKGSSYIPLPKMLSKKQAIINFKNEDNQCFKWAVTRALNPKTQNPERIDKDLQEKAKEFDWSGIAFPVSLKHINKFERQNPTISVNVYGYESCVYPLKISNNKSETIVNLLLISNDETQHYCLIKNMSRLLYSHATKKHCERFYCPRCLNGFTSNDSLQKHREYCDQHDAVKVIMSEPDTMIEFKHFYKSMRIPFIIYADFEAFTKPINRHMSI